MITFAGRPGLKGYTNGPGSKAQFRLPNSIAIDHAGNIYVADTANDVIRKITPDGVVSTLAGSVKGRGSANGKGPKAQFWAPFGIAVDAAGNVFVADTANNTIRKITPDGNVTTLAGEAGKLGSADGTGSAARFRNPWGVAVDSAGNVFVADMSNDTIRKINPAGQVFTYAGQPGESGNTDGFGNGARFNHPFAVAADSAGNVYVSDTANNAIRKIALDHVVTTLAGLSGNAGNTDGNGGDARFWNPQGLTVDSAGNIYVADTDNNLIREITPMGVVTTLLEPSDGSQTTNQIPKLNNPGSVAVDSSGNIFIADTNDHCIREIKAGK
jgi:sugar lactone lactonase YvrE